MSENKILLKKQSGPEKQSSTQGHYLLNGSFYEGLEDKYKLNDDGVSVYIPYAKITEDNAE